MYNRIIQHCKRMCTAPPSRCIGRVAAMCGPAVSFIFFQPVEITDIFRKTDCFEYAHILAAGEYISALNPGIDTDDTAGDKFSFSQLEISQLGGKRIDKVPPDQRLIGNSGIFANRNFGKVDDVKMLFQKLLAFLLCGLIVVKYMEGIGVFIFRVDAISGKSAAQSVRTVMHDSHRMDYRFTADQSAVFCKHTADGTAGRNTDIAFSYGVGCHRISSLFMTSDRYFCKNKRSQLFRFFYPAFYLQTGCFIAPGRCRCKPVYIRQMRDSKEKRRPSEG